MVQCGLEIRNYKACWKIRLVGKRRLAEIWVHIWGGLGGVDPGHQTGCMQREVGGFTMGSGFTMDFWLHDGFLDSQWSLNISKTYARPLPRVYAILLFVIE